MAPRRRIKPILTDAEFDALVESIVETVMKPETRAERLIESVRGSLIDPEPGLVDRLVGRLRGRLPVVDKTL